MTDLSWPRPGVVPQGDHQVGSGDILHFEDTSVHFRGDPECVPGIETLEDIDIASLTPPLLMPSSRRRTHSAEPKVKMWVGSSL